MMESESMKFRYLIVVAALAACASRPSDPELAMSIARGLAAACPAGTNPADEGARNECAGRLTDLAVLRDAMRAQNVPLSARNELLEILAPMKRDVVKL